MQHKSQCHLDLYKALKSIFLKKKKKEKLEKKCPDFQSVAYRSNDTESHQLE